MILFNFVCWTSSGLPCQFHVLFLPLVLITQYSCWVNPYNILDFSGPFYSFGHLWPISSFLLLTFPWAFTKSFGLPRPNYHILYLWIHWPFESISFTNSFLWAYLTRFVLSFYFSWFPLACYFILWDFLDSFACFGATLLFCEFMDHYSCHSSLMAFTLLLFLSSTLFIL